MAIPAWTYSQLDSFESSAKKYYHLRVVRDIVEPPTVHTEWGHKVHKALEDFINDGVALPEGMNQWTGIATQLARMRGRKLTEIQLSINNCFQPSDWKESWSRGIIDLLILDGSRAVVVDWKTGKRKPTEQLMLYAAYVFATYPEIDEVQTAFVWLKEKKLDRETFTRDQVADIWQKFLPRVRRLEIAYEKNVWHPSPSGLCNGWCPVKTCTYNKSR